MCCFYDWPIQHMIHPLWRRLADYLGLDNENNLRISCRFFLTSLCYLLMMFENLLGH